MMDWFFGIIAGICAVATIVGVLAMVTTTLGEPGQDVDAPTGRITAFTLFSLTLMIVFALLSSNASTS